MKKPNKKSQKKSHQKKSKSPLSTIWINLVLVVAIGVFIFISLDFDLTQDDAYISFRYAANLLEGEGLVFNYGERVEGYTNFLWVMLLAAGKGLLGLDFLFTSRLFGVISGAVIFMLTLLMVRTFFEKSQLAIFTACTALLLSNLSLPYWAIASLETTTFACMILLALFLEYKKPSLTPVILIIATLLRPEGGLVFFVILVNRLIQDRKVPLQYILFYVLPLIPFAIFKITYFGSLFPNPYYAKSGVGIEYILSGFEYLWHFTETLGVFGIIFLLPLIAIKQLWKKFSLLYLFTGFYIAYIVWVGGDVLKVYRFFVPVVPVLYFLLVASLFEISKQILKKSNMIISLTVFLTLIISAASMMLSRDHINAYWYAEKNIISKMHFMGHMLKKHMGDDFSIAASTIGIVSYQLLGHRVIDMLGLTDSYIAKNPEQIEGMSSSWKERRFNTRYLLEQQPDFILFSTGYKPSAPAERALMLHSEFRRNYSTTGFQKSGSTKVVFMRHGEIDMSRDRLCPNLEFVNHYHQGFNYMTRQKWKESLSELLASEKALGEEFTMLIFQIGECYRQLGQIDSARVRIARALELEPNCWEARVRMAYLLQQAGDIDAANEHYQKLNEMVPWLSDQSYVSPFSL